MPLEVLALAAKENEAKLAWLSVTTPQPVAKLRKEVERLTQDLAQSNTTLVLGGQKLPRLLNVNASNLNIAGSMAELSAFARGLRQMPPPNEPAFASVAPRRP